MSTKNNLEKLKEQQKKLEARIQAIEARNKVAERKKDTRRKILVGSYYLEQAEKNKDFKSIQKVMDSFLVRNSDRVLFDLPEISEK